LTACVLVKKGLARIGLGAPGVTAMAAAALASLVTAYWGESGACCETREKVSSLRLA